MSEIRIERLSCGYGQRILLNDLSFSVDGPSFLAVLGHNGCGKTTFFKALLNSLPFQGEILLKGRNNKHLSRNDFPALLGSLFQSNPVLFDIRVEELVVMGRFRHKDFFARYTRSDYLYAHQALERLGLLHLSKKQFGNLSGGEKQMVWIAQLLVQDPQIFLLDEPTQHLDLKNRKKVFILASELVAAGKTVLCITHDLHSLHDMNGRLLNLSVENPAPEEISDENLKRHIRLLESGSSADTVLKMEEV